MILGIASLRYIMRVKDHTGVVLLFWSLHWVIMLIYLFIAILRDLCTCTLQVSIAVIFETVPSRYGHWSMTIELVKLNNQVWLYSVYFYKLCPHLVALFSGDYFATFNSLLLIEEIHFQKNSVVTFHISCYYVLSRWY